MPATKPVIVVGAGIGGLVAALELAVHGVDVLVLERASAPGGKVRELEVNGRRLDAGPTVFTMRWVFDEIFAAAGTSTAAELSLTPLPVLARHAWSESEKLDLHADPAAAVAAIGAFAGAAEARRYLEFCERARRIYTALEAPFLRATRPGPLALMTRSGLRGLPELLRIAPFTTLWRALGRHFHDPRLRQLFGRYATYCGSSPFTAPATLMLVAHVEQAGVWSVDGGMHVLVRSLHRLAIQRGVTFRFEAEVATVTVRQGHASGVTLASGEAIDSAAVVFNGDCNAVAAGLLGTAIARGVPRTPIAARSLSALTWAEVAVTAGFPLLRHNVFFGGDYANEFAELGERAMLPQDPTVYVCAQDRHADGTLSEPGAERLLCLVNAPAIGDRHAFTPLEIDACEQRTWARLRRCGLTLTRSTPASCTTPTEFARLFPGTGGALYGRAAQGWRASFARPGARSRLPGLYLAGGSTHPGPGVPMAALSGRLAAASVLQDFASTRRSHPVAMPGGMSTPGLMTERRD